MNRAALAHLGLHFVRIQLLLQRYMRRHSDRLVDNRDAYTDDRVGLSELRRCLGLISARGGQPWIEHLGLYPEPELEARLDDLHHTLSTHATPHLPTETLRAAFGLSQLDLDLLILAAAPRLSIDISRVFKVLLAGVSDITPTAGVIADILATPDTPANIVLESFGTSSALIRNHLVTLHEHPRWRPDTPRAHALVTVPQRVLDHLTHTPHTLPGCRLYSADEACELRGLEIPEAARERLIHAMRSPGARLILEGAPGSGRRSALGALGAAMGRALLVVERADELFESPERLGVSLSEVLREARLQHAVLLLRLPTSLDPDTTSAMRSRIRDAEERLAEHPGAVAISTDTADGVLSTLLGRPSIVTFTSLEPERLATLWTRALAERLDAERAAPIAERLAAHHPIAPGRIEDAIETALGKPARRRSERLSQEALLEVVQGMRTHRLGWLADVVTARGSLDDVVLTPEARVQLEEVMRFARHASKVFDEWRFDAQSSNGRGLSVLFSGPPGTGKTLVAGVLAGSLSRQLYRVDLSRIVDKYIGETEKNLARVFSEAESAHAVLLFDEADSLFATRTSVKSSNDRYANLEVNYLLQRLDAFNGVSILTTNFAQSIDDAFQRRIRFKIDFPMPDAEQRAELWQTLLPPGAPRSESIHFERLGEAFELTGGHIRNAILRAAMVAAERGQSIQHTMLWSAARDECRELGVLVAPEWHDELDVTD